MNVDMEHCSMNVHYKDSGGLTYNEQLQKLIDEDKVSTRGLKADAKVFDEVIFDVNTDYFEKHGGYEYAKKFYAEVYRFAVNLYGEQNIISAVMHADELNIALTEEKGKPIYHYHMHLVALPVVEKEIRWTKRSKDPALVGKVKCVINQISHSKKWKSPQATDENGKVILNAKGKPVLIPSYSILQDDFYAHMKNAGFGDFIRGEKGSTAEHLTCLEYEIQQDKKRLEEIKQQVKSEEIHYDEVHTVNKTFMEIEKMGKKSITGKVTVSAEDFKDLTTMAKQSVTARSRIFDLERELKKLRERNWDLQSRINHLEEQLRQLKERCEPYLKAIKLMPEKVKSFIEDVINTDRENKNINKKKEKLNDKNR